MIMMMNVIMANGGLGAGAARTRNCNVTYFGEGRSNGVKWVMSTGSHKFGFLSHMAVIKEQTNISAGNGLEAEL